MRGASLAGVAFSIVAVIGACSGANDPILNGTPDGGSDTSVGGSSGGGSGSGSGGSSGSGSGGGSGGSSGGSSGSSSGGTIVDASSDVTVPPSCKPSPADGGACNSLVPPSSAVTVQCNATQPVPAPVGGVIGDGTYVMVSSMDYANGGTCAPAEVDNTMWRICGTSWQTAQTSAVTGQNPYTLIANATVVPAGSTLAITLTCGSTVPPLTFGYDASGNTLRLHINGSATAGRVDTFQRQ